MKKAILILSILLSSCSIYKKENVSDPAKQNKEQIYNNLFINFSDKNITINYGSEFLPESLVIDSNGKITFPAPIDTAVIGTTQISYKVSSIEYPEVEKEYVVTITVTDKVSETYQKFVCSDKYFYFKNINDDPISFVLNPDGNNDHVNFVIGYHSRTIDQVIFRGKFFLVKDNVYSFSEGLFNEDLIHSDDKPNFGNEVDGYFKLENDKLYFISEILLIEEMQKYSSATFCTLQ